MDQKSRRLTRSTYIGEPSTLHNRKTRSSSTDSENGWIPPPPLLSLDTKFLITNPQTCSHLSRSLSPLHSEDPISTSIAIAHLKCQPSNSSHNPQLDSDVSTSFRILEDHELAQQLPFISQSNSHPQDDSSDFIQIENKSFSRRHRQSEMIEKRSKKLEKEKLLHERFKLKDRLDILMKGSGTEWKSVRTLTLKRIKEDELKERSIGNPQLHQSEHHPRETEFDKVERMRHILIQETEEILKRYDKLLDTRKMYKARTGAQPLEAKANNPTSTPDSQLKITKQRSTPTSFKRKPVHPTSSDPDHPQKSTKRNHQRVSKLNTTESIQPQEGQVPLNYIKRPVDPLPMANDQQSTSTPFIQVKSPDPQLATNVKMDDKQTVPSRTTPLASRESLYDSASIRRSAMDEQLLNGKKRVGRSTYALGCRLPDLNEIQLDYLSELQSMVPGKSASPRTTPFDRPERRHHQAVSPSKNSITDRGHLIDESQNWIEFNPTVNEEKEIIAHQAEFGIQSKFFELDGELEYLEEQKINKFHHNQFELSGKSIRKLIQERIHSWHN